MKLLAATVEVCCADPTLLGNRIAALTSAVGIPPCGSCGKRKGWLNRAHQWIRSL